jgi:hypothetical protein
MTRFDIAPDVALHLARIQGVVPTQHQLLAPSLFRSQVLAQLYTLVGRCGLTPSWPNTSR